MHLISERDVYANRVGLRVIPNQAHCVRSDLTHYTSRVMQERTVTISNRLGLHARAAARLVRRASQFNSNVTLLRKDTGETADGKSILSVLLLAASLGTSLIIKTEGDDEERAVNALVELVEQKFGEELSDGVF